MYIQFWAEVCIGGSGVGVGWGGVGAGGGGGSGGRCGGKWLGSGSFTRDFYRARLKGNSIPICK